MGWGERQKVRIASAQADIVRERNLLLAREDLYKREIAELHRQIEVLQGEINRRDTAGAFLRAHVGHLCEDPDHGCLPRTPWCRGKVPE